MKILNFPITRATFWFILGIISCYYLKPSVYIGFGLLLFSLVFLLFSYVKSKSVLNQTSRFGLALYFVFFSIGISTTIIHNDSFKKNHYSNFETFFTKNHIIKVTVAEKLKSTTNNNRYVAIISNIDTKSISGKILINIKKDSLLPNYAVGTQLLIQDQLVKNFKPNNPNQFDYGNYLESKNIYAQLFTENSQIKINTEIKKNLWYFTSKFRNTIIDNLSHSGFKKEELAVV